MKPHQGASARPLQLVLISGLSGSGKSIALNVLEDAGYFCVDNLPTPLLPQLVSYLRDGGQRQVAVAVDSRALDSVSALPSMVQALKNGTDLRFIFLEARDDTLIQRFSETRRRHPLAGEDTTLPEAIAREREALAELVSLGHRIDTSDLKPAALRAWVKDLVRGGGETVGLTLLFESFGFKHGIPLDADLVFDVRCLPNPHYDVQLRPLTGMDGAVISFLENQPDVLRMRDDIRRFVADWLPAYVRDNRSYLTVAIGCTGGQHRSVYFVEWLADQFRDAGRVLTRHRSLAG